MSMSSSSSLDDAAPIDSKSADSRLPMYSPWYCLTTSKKTFCMKMVSVGPVTRARQRVLVGLGLELVAGHHLVEEVALEHLVGGERPSGEHHFLELAQSHGLYPRPHPRPPAVVAERRMAEQRVVGRDHQVRVGGLIEVPAVAVALRLDDADLLEFLQRSIAGLRVREPLRRSSRRVETIPWGDT